MTANKPKFMTRAFTTVVVAGSFLMLLISGGILFVAPPGRVANWGNWSMLGLSKHDWGGLHTWFAILFITAALVHLTYNLRPMLNYFRDRLTRRVSYRREWLVAVVVCGVVFVGTKTGFPPFSSVLAFSETLKKGWEDPRSAAPVPHAELLTLAELAEQAKIPYEIAEQKLATSGIRGLLPEYIVATIAKSNNTTPQHVFEIIAASRGRGGSRAEGENSSHKERAGRGGFGGGGPGAGAGRRTLAEYCSSRSLDLQASLARLRNAGIEAKPERSLREIALDNGIERPYEIIDIIEGNE